MKPIYITLLCCATALTCQFIHEQHEDERNRVLSFKLQLGMDGISSGIEFLKP